MRTALWCLAGGAFVILATANGAGYRYGVSDQAFYIPAVTRALDQGAFPRDAALIDAQGRLMTADDVLAAIVRATGLSVEAVFFGGYLLSLAAIWAGLVLIGTHLYRSAWLTIALGAAFTLRHRIPRTSANSFEPYFHPRMLAFGLGALAVAALLRRRPGAAIALIAVAAAVHVTTALWFTLLVGTALVILHPSLRRPAVAGTVVVAAAGVWAVTAGPLRESLTRMDGTWLQAVAAKDSLFPSQWPLWAWAANLGMLAVLWWAHGRRRRNRAASREDAALAWGATALVALVLLTLPLVTWRLALPVQLQITRVFWLLDLVALVYVLALADDRRAHASVARASGASGASVAGSLQASGTRQPLAAIVAVLLLALSVTRGIYILTVERPDRALFTLRLPDSPWQDAMAWVSRQPLDTHVLADPGHAWKYETSVRVSPGRDVLLEEVKDSAIAIYSRDVAARVVERTAAVGDFTALTPERALELARAYDLDYLVTEADLPLPETYRNTQFRIYGLDSPAGPGVGSDVAPN